MVGSKIDNLRQRQRQTDDFLEWLDLEMDVRKLDAGREYCDFTLQNQALEGFFDYCGGEADIPVVSPALRWLNETIESMSALGLESYDRALNDPKLQHLHERIQDLRDNHCANTELLKFPTSRAGITLMASGHIGSAASKAGTILRISTNSVVNVFKVGMKAAKIRTEKTVKIFDVRNGGGLGPIAESAVPSYNLPHTILSTNQRKSFKAKLGDRTLTKSEYQQYQWDKRLADRRKVGVNEFWLMERDLLKTGNPGTRNWSKEQVENILLKKAPKYNEKTMHTHHMYSVQKYPQLANDPFNLYPVTLKEHLWRWHDGKWKNPSHGKPLNPKIKEEF